MSLSGFSIKRPVTIVMLVCALLVFGFVSLPKLAVELLPELNLPIAVVVTTANGSDPGEVEKLVTKPIEEALGTVANVKEINSNSAEGASQVIVQFNWGVDMDQATLNMRDKIDGVRGMLPDEAGSPRILRLDPNSMPIITMSLSGDKDIVKLKSIAENTIKSRLERVDGVASVSVSGGKDRIIDVVLDPAKIASYGITLDQVQQAMMATNLSGSAGVVRQGEQKMSIRVDGEFETVESIGKTQIHVGTGSIALKDIATISDTYKEVTQKSTTNGEPSVGLSIIKATGGNTIEVADAVNKELENLKEDLPEGTKINMILDSSTFIKDSIYTVGEHALIGGFFSILILLLFLNSVRSMLIVAVVIPISVIATFTLMYFTGQTINLISLSGLTLGLGSLVDFAVVILENIYRHRQAGKGMMEAAKLGSSEVGTAVMASALAQIAVFLPIVFVDGLAAELFGPLALTVVYSHIAALFASLALVPMLSSRWLKKVPMHEGEELNNYKGKNPLAWFNVGFNRVARGYGKLLGWALGHRKSVFAITIALFVGALALTPLVGAEFMPTMDQGKITVAIKMPVGTLLKETEQVTAAVQEKVDKIPELDQVYTSIGSSGGPALLASATANKAQIDISLVDKLKRTRSTDEIIEDLRKQLDVYPGADITVKVNDQSGGPTSSAIDISLRGDDLNVLQDISDIIAGEVKSVQGTRNVTTSLQEKTKQFQVKVDPQKASLYGLTTNQVLSSVRTAFDGTTISKFRTGDDEFDVRLKMPDSFKEDISYLNNYRISTASGAQVALSSIAAIKLDDVPNMISRTNQTREVRITADLAGRDLRSVSTEIQKKLDALNLPEGYSIETGGQNKDMMESFSSLGLAIILSIVLVYMVMAGQFESYFSPFVIMFSIPPTFIGVVVGLLVTGNSLSVSAMIGYILLVGIVVNNAIVLIDYVNHLRQGGMERNEAILKAGPVRLRPILMTTLATVLAIMPLAFGGGSGNESQAPMAVVVIFGLSFSTLITLVLIPVVYTYFDDKVGKMRRFKFKFGKKKVKPIGMGIGGEK